MKFHAPVALALGTLFLAPSAAQAQPEFIKDGVSKIIRKVGVHANMSVREPIDSDVTKGVSFGGAVVLGGSQKTGWKFPSLGLTTFNETLHAPGGDHFAELKSWAIVGGIGYGWGFGKLHVSPGLQTGVAFNRGRLDTTAPQAFNADGPVSLKVGNSVLLKPKLTLEYFLTRKFTVRTSADYMLTRPSITVMTPTGAIGDRWNASSFHATVGMGFYPFRK